MEGLKLFVPPYLKNGYDLASMQRKTMPAAQRSTAVFCLALFSSTSGGRNPGVPARGAFWCGRSLLHLHKRR